MKIKTVLSVDCFTNKILQCLQNFPQALQKFSEALQKKSPAAQALEARQEKFISTQEKDIPPKGKSMKSRRNLFFCGIGAVAGAHHRYAVVGPNADTTARVPIGLSLFAATYHGLAVGQKHFGKSAVGRINEKAGTFAAPDTHTGFPQANAVVQHGAPRVTGRTFAPVFVLVLTHHLFDGGGLRAGRCQHKKSEERKRKCAFHVAFVWHTNPKCRLA